MQGHITTKRKARVKEELEQLKARLRELEEGWGDWLRVPPPPDRWLYDPYLAWAWPHVRGEYYLLQERRAELLALLRRTR